MTSRKTRVPGYGLHKASGQAVVRLNGKDHYLGKHGSDESHARYEVLIATWLQNGRRPVECGMDGGWLTVNGLALRYYRFAEVYYRRADGTPTEEPRSIAYAMRPLCELFGRTPAEDFGPKRLKEARQLMIHRGWSRRHINLNVGRVKRAFKWATSEELVPPAVFHGLQSVAGLKRGRSEARDTEPIRPVEEADMWAVLPHVSRQVAAMIELQWLTGMRPGEVVQMRTADIDRSEDVWLYRPRQHKTQHHGKTRVVPLGPKAQEVLRPFLKLDRDAFCFSPREAEEERWSARRHSRQTPMTPSHRARTRKRKPKRTPRESYDTQSYGRAIADGCKKAGVPHWAPNRLRHSAATRIKKAQPGNLTGIARAFDGIDDRDLC